MKALACRWAGRRQVGLESSCKNDPDQAFKWLDAARGRLQSKDMLIAGKELMWILQGAPFLKPLHADARWQALLASIDVR
jgi:hypothetical protein